MGEGVILREYRVLLIRDGKVFKKISKGLFSSDSVPGAASFLLYRAAGQPGWAAIIPIYNLYILIKIAGKPGWWILMFLIPFLNLIFLIWLYNMVSKSFGKDEGFTAGLVILGFIFWPILGFGSAKYLGPFGDPQAFQSYQGKDKFDFEPS